MRVLELFCGGGGSGWGYHLAGLEVVGVDWLPQRYPFRFVRGEALAVLRERGRQFDLVHASPPCQKYSKLNRRWRRPYPDLIAALREVLMEVGVDYVIENVPQAPVRKDLLLCGAMFGLGVVRHRVFECSFPVAQPEHPAHGRGAVTVTGHCSGPRARAAMGIGWMTRRALAQAVPPAYTHYIGEQWRGLR